jgi:hypothetical protein
MQLVPKAMTDGPASSSYVRRRSRVVAVRAVEVDTRQLPFTAIIHRNGIANANVCAVTSGGNMKGENTSGKNITGESSE